MAVQGTWISSRDLNGRITAGQFLSSSLRSMEKIKNGKYETCSISQIGKVRGGKRLPPNSRYVTDGIPYVRSTDIRDLRVDFSQVVRISIEHQRRIANYPLKYRDVVISIAGTIGTIGLVDENIGPCHFNENLARITDIQIDPAYLAVYLDSRFGQAFIDYLKGGAVQPKLSLININRIQVPRPPDEVQDRIAGVMQAAYASRREKLAEAEGVSADLKSQVSRIIFGKSSLVLQKTTRTHTVSISKMKAARRFDVGFFGPEYIQLDEMLGSLQNVKRLGDMAEVQYGFMPTEDYATKENGVPLIRVTNIASDDGSIDMSDVKYVRATSERLHEKLVREKDILMVQCGNTTGKAAIVSKEHEGHAYASFCFRIRPRGDEVLPEYLLAVLQSDIGHMQVWRSITFATVRPNTTKPFTEALQVPIPPKPVQRQILQLIELKRTEAKRLRAEAEQLVVEAKAKVERMILGEEGA